MGQNMSLSLQPWIGRMVLFRYKSIFYHGLKAKKGQPGLGFEFEFNNDWGVPNPTGISDLYQSMSPPHYNTMSEAVDAFIEEFGKTELLGVKTIHIIMKRLLIMQTCPVKKLLSACAK